MILRRITMALKRQDWITVSIETLIVVLGVFLGLQANNWNEARVERGIADALVERMIGEARDAKAALGAYRHVHTEIRDRATELALRLAGVEKCLAATDELKTLVIVIGDFPPPRFSLPNAKQSLNTGELALVRSAELRDSVQKIVDEMDFLERQWQRYVRIKQDTEQEVAKAAGLELTGYGALKSGEVIGLGDMRRYKIKTPDRICGNADVIALVSNVEITQQVYSVYLEQVDTSLNKYLATLQNYAGGARQNPPTTERGR
ncbi:MAG: hypothetical protein R3C51_01140 [Parvularculaceae bacterium]